MSQLPPPLLPPAFPSIPNNTKNWQHAAVAGAVSFGLPTVALHPFRVSATRRVVDPANYTSTVQSLYKITTQEGLSSLNPGLGRTLLLSATTGALLFSAYSAATTFLDPNEPDDLRKITKHSLIAGSIAGVATAILIPPFEALVIKSATGLAIRPFQGFGAFSKWLDGWNSYVSFTITARSLILHVPQTALLFAAFATAHKQTRESLVGHTNIPAPELSIDATSGSIAGIASGVLAQIIGKIAGWQMGGLRMIAGSGAIWAARFAIFGFALRKLEK